MASLLVGAGGRSVCAGQDTSGRTLLATVTDSVGRTMVDFGVDDFVVREGGQEREVLDVHIADYPVALVLDDTAEPQLWPTLRAAAIRFVTRIGERPVIIGTLGGNGRVVAELELDRATMLQRLSEIPRSDTVGSTVLPALAAVGRLLKATDSPFSAIVVVAAGPLNPETVPGQLLPEILESGATVDVVVGRGRAGGDDVLKAVADQTRGQYAPIFTTASYGIALDRLADRMAAQIMVQYLVPPGARTADAQVGVRRPGARVSGLGVSK